MEKVALESVTPAGQQPKPAWSMRPAGCRSANRCCAIEAPCVHARVEVPHPHPAPPQLPLVVFDFVVVGTLRRALPPEQRAKCPGSRSTVTPVRSHPHLFSVPCVLPGKALGPPPCAPRPGLAFLQGCTSSALLPNVCHQRREDILKCRWDCPLGGTKFVWQ